MRRMTILGLLMMLSFIPPCLAQQYELGGLGGYGWQGGLSAKTDTASATTGFRPGAAIGIVFGDNLYSQIGGEVRYLFRWSDLKVESGGQKASFNGESHIIHYDFLFHTRPTDAPTRPFFAVGLGAKIFKGTGNERAFQPLTEFVLLTKATDILPVISLGGGVKWNWREHVGIRVEVRDYWSPSPQKVLVPHPAARIAGWLHDIVPMVGIAYRF